MNLEERTEEILNKNYVSELTTSIENKLNRKISELKQVNGIHYIILSGNYDEKDVKSASDIIQSKPNLKDKIYFYPRKMMNDIFFCLF